MRRSAHIYTQIELHNDNSIRRFIQTLHPLRRESPKKLRGEKTASLEDIKKNFRDSETAPPVLRLITASEFHGKTALLQLISEDFSCLVGRGGILKGASLLGQEYHLFAQGTYSVAHFGRLLKFELFGERPHLFLQLSYSAQTLSDASRRLLF